MSTHHVVAVLQLCAGSGKTTLATNLAGELSRFCSVALIDCHPLSRRASKWGAQRQDDGRSTRGFVVQAAATPPELLERAYRLRERVDYVVLDGPNDPHMTKAVAAMSELCLVPVLPVEDGNGFCAPTISVLREARQLRRFRVRAVTMRQRTDRYREAARLDVAKSLKTVLCERQAYSAALATGGIASESRDPMAKEELANLLQEVSSLVSLDRAARQA